jgi:hypothetical protein
MKTAIILTRAQLPHQTTWGNAFAEGLRRHGWRANLINASEASGCDMLVMWGVTNERAIALQRQRGGEVCIIERGYVGDRFAYASVSFGGGLNGRGIFRGPFHDGSRWERHHAHLLKPWRRRDGYALLIGQVPGDQSIAGVDIDAWYRRAAADLKSAGWDVRFRAHPVAVQRGYTSGVPGVPTIGGDLASALDGAGVVVTFNSNTGVESVLAGVPTITMDQGAMAYPVTGHELGKMQPTPDRTGWAYALAWKQWRMEEMLSGVCWDAVGSVQAQPTGAGHTRAAPLPPGPSPAGP